MVYERHAADTRSIGHALHPSAARSRRTKGTTITVMQQMTARMLTATEAIKLPPSHRVGATSALSQAYLHML